MYSKTGLEDGGTHDTLITVARELFAKHGFKGTTVRGITSAAGTNLGAVTYHFGSKLELFHAVLEDATSAVRRQLANLGAQPGDAIGNIEATVRVLFAALRRDPVIPRLILHVLASERPLPPPVLLTMKTVIGHLTHLIESGQRDGSIRPGQPQMLALTLGSHPIFFGIYRRALREAVGFDQSDEDTSQHLVDTVVDFIRAGLTPPHGTSAHTAERN